MNKYSVAIIGAGPAGLSAAGRAEYHSSQNEEFSYVLLEAFDKPAKTIQKYQKGKLVMAEPSFLSLRSDFNFKRGSRENVLAEWQRGLDELGLNIRYQSEVVSVSGEDGDFKLCLKSGEILLAKKVVLSIGLEGNPRLLGVEGDNYPIVQYTLDDPDAFSGEEIIVVGAGDSAIENALALSKNNNVKILNRKNEFSRAKEGNLNSLLKASSDKKTKLEIFYSTTVKSIRKNNEGKYSVTLAARDADIEVHCDRLICRLGAIPPRKFLESFGVEFPSGSQSAIPDLSAQYESNVKGVYIIGSLGGYPLIKQAMNQGYDVIEYIRGNNIKPADHPLLKLQFSLLPYRKEVEELTHLFQRRIPMFSQLNYLQFRELLIESSVYVSYGEQGVLNDMERRAVEIENQIKKYNPKPKFTNVLSAGTEILQKGEYSTTFYTIAEGKVVVTQEDGSEKSLGRGEFFGEFSLLSGRAQEERVAVTANTILVGTPRRTMLKLMSSNENVRDGIDLIYIIRALQKTLVPNLSVNDLLPFARKVTLETYKAGETIYEHGEIGDKVYVVRRGSINLYRRAAYGDVLVSQQQSGTIVGEMALMGNPVRRETARATVYTEVVSLVRDLFLKLIDIDRSKISKLQEIATFHAVKYSSMEVRPERGSVIEFMMNEGVGESTNCFVISENLCIGCDNCERACADTHDGISRLIRSEGPSFGGLHVPITCRHCEQPHCMKDCPPDALHRSEDGEVYIDDKCIGCGNCVTNCPYGAIKLAYDAPKKPGLLRWFVFGGRGGSGEEPNYSPSSAALEKGKKAVKCDACVSLKGGPACVNACPTGAAARVAPDDFIRILES